MKSLIFWVVIGVAGYLAYQYVVVPWMSGSGPAKPTATEYMVFIPDQCQSEGESLKDAFLRHEKGEIGKVSLNGFTQNFRRCLRKEGLTSEEIDEAYNGMKN